MREAISVAIYDGIGGRKERKVHGDTSEKKKAFCFVSEAFLPHFFFMLEI